jgi:cell division protein ZipA
MMQANWSLILNVLLLVGVIVAIGRLMKARRHSLGAERQPSKHIAAEKNFYSAPSYGDDIIAVRKVNSGPVLDRGTPPSLKANATQPRLLPDDEDLILNKTSEVTPMIAPVAEEMSTETYTECGPTVMMFILAKENRQFAGYELLQSVLAAGLRFGDGGLFHRYQYTNGDGSIICSLAAATAAGIFDLQNIGAFSVRGLCLYMQATTDVDVNAQRFAVMMDTARQLSEGLDAYLLDDQRRPLTEERIAYYQHILEINQVNLESVAV